jgi:hypothetical protein
MSGWRNSGKPFTQVSLEKGENLYFSLQYGLENLNQYNEAVEAPFEIKIDVRILTKQFYQFPSRTIK